MKKLNVMAVVVVVAAALTFGSGASAEYRVLGESLDSGLGNLGAGYTGAEFMPASPHRVLGEKLDSGLGELTHAQVIRLVAGR